MPEQSTTVTMNQTGWPATARLRRGAAAPWLTPLLLALTLLACGSTATRVPEVSRGKPEGEPWARLRVGDLEGAEAILERWRARNDTRALAIAGQLRIASLTRDVARIDQLLGAVPEGSPFALRMLAADAAMTDVRLTAQERAVVAAACPAPPEAADKPVVQTICAHAALFDGRDELMVCREGCDASQRAPLLSAGALAVVMVSIGGSDPVPMIVDTGAATSTLTNAFAKEQGLNPVPGSQHPVGSSGGRVDAPFVLASLGIGDRLVTDVRFAVVDVSVAGVAGVLSPHDVFRGTRVTLDFRDRVMELGPSLPAPPADMVGFPLLFQARRPHLMVAVGGREPRPLAIDTGSDRTRLTSELEELGEPLPRAGEKGSLSIGGLVPVAETRAVVPAEAGALRFELDSPLVFATPRVAAPFDLGSFGLLGLDFVEGRRIAVDAPARRLDISRQAALRAWPVGSKQEVVISGRDFPEPIVVTEEVTGRDGDRVKLDVTWSRGEASEHLRLALVDDYTARGTWLITRPIVEAWRLAGGSEASITVDEARQRLAKLLTLFQTRGQAAFDTVAEDGRTCGRVSIPARLDGAKAVLRVVSCPYGAWRVKRVQLEQGGQLVWQLEQRA